jgi:phosphonate transport system substrate-binding protein
MKLLKLPSLIILLIASLPIAGTTAASEQTYLFGVFPYLSPIRMDEIYSPVSQDLSKNLGQRVKFRTSSNLPRFREKLMSEYYDFAFIQPVFYPLVVDQAGYIPIVRMEEPIFSVIMVLESSPIRSIQDLKGKKIATPPVFGPVVSLAKRSLIKHGISPDTDVYFKTNKTIGACFQKIMVGQADACVAPNFAVKTFEKSMGLKFRTIMRSEGIPNQSMVVHPRVSEQVRNQIRQILLSWSSSEKGRKLLGLMNTKGFVELKDSEYDIVRSFVQQMKK